MFAFFAKHPKLDLFLLRSVLEKCCFFLDQTIFWKININHMADI